MNQDNLIFVCGALRSGTSLLHLMLNHHPELKNPGEYDFFFDMVSDEYHPPQLDSYKSWLSTHRIFISKKLVIPPAASNYSQVLNSFKDQLSEEGKVLLINIHRHFDRIPSFFPEAKYIHLVRDPRDVARSSIGMGWAGNVYYGVDHWLATERSWNKLKTKLSEDKFLEIHFEDLIKNPEDVLQNICKFSGVSFEPSMLNYHQNSTYEKPNINLIYQWRTKLSKDEVQQVESKVSRELQDLNYELSNYGVFDSSFSKRLYLKVQNKFFKLRFAIKRYGFSLVIRERIARLLNFKKQSKIVRMKMNEIDQSIIK